MSCECNNIQEFTWDGTGLKYAVSMTCEGFDMDEDDWKITVSRGSRKVEFTPENAIHEVTTVQGQEVSTWYICIDTSLLGPGELHIIFDAKVPDDDFDEGFRHEIQKYKLINVKNL